MEHNNHANKQGITVDMSPAEKAMQSLRYITRNYLNRNVSDSQISPQALSVRDSLITYSLDLDNPNREVFPNYGDNENRDINIFIMRCGYDGTPPMTHNSIGQETNMTRQNARTQHRKVSKKLFDLTRPFIPFDDKHLARQAWYATCGYDVLEIIDPMTDQRLIDQAPIYGSQWNNPQNLDQVPSYVCQSLNPDEQKYLLTTLNSLFPQE